MAFTGYCESVKYTFCSFAVLSISAVAHIGLVALFVGQFDMGFQGVLVASALHFVVRFLTAFIYTNFFVEPFYSIKNITMFQEDTFNNLKPQVLRGFGSLFMGCWNWWAFDIFTLICSYISIYAISAQTIMRSLGLLTFMIPVGFSKASGFYIGKFIGQGCEMSIKHYYQVAISLGVLVGGIQIVALWAFESNIINFYLGGEASDQEEQALVQEQLYLAWGWFLAFVFFDTIQGISMSAIRASGQQTLGAFITGTAYFIVGIPLALYLSFKVEYGIRGIWLSCTSSVFFLTVAYAIVVSRIDWQKIIHDAAVIRRENEEKKLRRSQARASKGSDDEFRKIAMVEAEKDRQTEANSVA